MSREINFRVWDGRSKQMSVQTVGPSDWGDYLVDFKDGAVDVAAAYAIWLQYTGLKDYDNVEIYEGDIVERLDERGRPIGARLRKQVQWTEGPQHVGWNFGTGQHEKIRLRVIGNIYENPELLGSRVGDE